MSSRDVISGDVVYAVDLELSIHYALTVEIPTQQFLDEVKMKTIYQYLEAIIQYLPMRPSTYAIKICFWIIAPVTQLAEVFALSYNCR